MDRSIFFKAALGAAVVFVLWCAGFLERSDTAQLQPSQLNSSNPNPEGNQ